MAITLCEYLYVETRAVVIVYSYRYVSLKAPLTWCCAC